MKDTKQTQIRLLTMLEVHILDQFQLPKRLLPCLLVQHSIPCQPSSAQEHTHQTTTGSTWTNDTQYYDKYTHYLLLSRIHKTQPGMQANTHTHNRFTALMKYVRDHPGEQVPER